MKNYHKSNISIVAMFVLLLVVASWYLTPFTPYDVVNEKEIEVTKPELDKENIVQKSNRYYYVTETTHKVRQKRLIPLLYKTNIVSVKKSSIYSRNN